MINFLLVSHGGMMAGLMSAVELISGKQTGIGLISLQEGDAIEQLGQKIEESISSLLPESTGIVIMVDLFGASTFNQAAIVASKFSNVEVITGLNLPMLLEVFFMRDSLSLSELTDHARQSGISGIRVLSELLEK